MEYTFFLIKVESEYFIYIYERKSGQLVYLDIFPVAATGWGIFFSLLFSLQLPSYTFRSQSSWWSVDWNISLFSPSRKSVSLRNEIFHHRHYANWKYNLRNSLATDQKLCHPPFFPFLIRLSYSFISLSPSLFSFFVRDSAENTARHYLRLTLHTESIYDWLRVLTHGPHSLGS